MRLVKSNNSRKRRDRRRNRDRDDDDRRRGDWRDRHFNRRNIPPTGVVAVPRDDFGNRRRAIHRAPNEIARRILSEGSSEIPSLSEEINWRRRQSEVLVENPREDRAARQIRTGATERRAGVPLNGELRRSRGWGNRPPVERQPDANDNRSSEISVNENRERRTGAIERPPRQTRRTEIPGDNNAAGNEGQVSPIAPAPNPQENENSGDDERRRPPENRNRDDNNENTPRRQESQPRSESPGEERRTRNQSPPEESREQPPERQPEVSRPEPPERSEPRREEPRREEPRREEPRQEKPDKKDSPKEVDKPEPALPKKIEKDG